MKRNESTSRRRVSSKPFRPFVNGNGPAENGCENNLPAVPVVLAVTEPKPTEKVANDGRDSTGRFAKGNKGGPGNPFARQVAALRSEFLGAVAPERIRCLAEQLYDRALKGDNAAAKLLLAYTLGNPATAIDPDRLDLDELRALMERPLDLQVFVQALNGVDAPTAIEFLAQLKSTPKKILDAMRANAANVNLMMNRMLSSRAKKS